MYKQKLYLNVYLNLNIIFVSRDVTKDYSFFQSEVQNSDTILPSVRPKSRPIQRVNQYTYRSVPQIAN
jgi:hypothetical protein